MVILGGNPIIMEETGWYFIDNAPSSAPFSGELFFTSMLLMTFKNFGIILFTVSITLYLLLTARDVKGKKVYRRRH